MKKSILIFLLTLVSFSLLAKKDWDVQYKQTSQGNELVFSLNHIGFETIEAEGDPFIRIQLEGAAWSDQIGWASVPFIHASLMLQAYEAPEISFQILESEEIQLEAPLLPAITDEWREDKNTYEDYQIAPQSLKDEWYPTIPIRNPDVFKIRQAAGQNIYFYPIQYNAQKQTLRVIRRIKVLIKEKSLAKSIDVLSEQFVQEDFSLFQNVFLNAKSKLPIQELKHADQGDLLVIVTDADQEAISPYIQWKEDKGFKVREILVDSGIDPGDIIKQAYMDNPKLFYVLLVGDWAELKMEVNVLSQNSPTDPKWGCVSGDDNYPDLAIGRFSCVGENDLYTQVFKTIRYEKMPDLEGEWYAHAMGIASDEGHQTKGDDLEADTAHQRVIWEERLRYFTYNKYVAVYDSGSSYQAKPMDVYNPVMAGVGLINYSGHGSQSAWSTTNFSANQAYVLKNGDKLPVIFSTACKNGAYHQGTHCFAEAWLRSPEGGAVAMLASSMNQPWAPPMRGQDYMMDILVGGYDYDQQAGNGINNTEQRTYFGSVVLNAMNLMYTESDNTSDLQTIMTWVTFGDPSLQIRTAKPKKVSLLEEDYPVGKPLSGKVLVDGEPMEKVMLCFSQGPNKVTTWTNEKGDFSVEHALYKGGAQLIVTGFNTETLIVSKNIVDNSGILDQEHYAKSFDIHPNPSKQGVDFLYVTESIGQTQIEIRDLSGQLVLHEICHSNFIGENKYHIDAAELNMPAGVYLVNIQLNEERFVSKLIKL